MLYVAELFKAAIVKVIAVSVVVGVKESVRVQTPTEREPFQVTPALLTEMVASESTAAISREMAPLEISITLPEL